MSGEDIPSRPSFRGRFWAKLALLALFLYFILPSCDPSPSGMRAAQAIHMAANGRQIWLASLNTAPNDASKDVWPKTDATFTARDYVTALIHRGALSEKDLRLFSGRSYPAAVSLTELSEKNIAFIIYRVSPDDPPETVFLASKPDVFKEYRIEIRKDGDARRYKVSESPHLIASLPKATPPTLLP